MSPPASESASASTRNWGRMSRGSRADRHAHADLARPLGDRHEHDVHDPDAADERATPPRSPARSVVIVRVPSCWALAISARLRIGEVVVAHRAAAGGGRASSAGIWCSARAVSAWLAAPTRHRPEMYVLEPALDLGLDRWTPGRTRRRRGPGRIGDWPLLEHADHLERHVLDPDRWPTGSAPDPKSWSATVLPSERHLRAGVHVGRVKSAALARPPVRDLEVVRGRARDGGGPVLTSSEMTCATVRRIGAAPRTAGSSVWMRARSSHVSVGSAAEPAERAARGRGARAG